MKQTFLEYTAAIWRTQRKKSTYRWRRFALSECSFRYYCNVINLCIVVVIIIIVVMKGYEWVGWRNDSTERPGSETGYVEIVFEFERVRNFTALRFHANNMFSKDVRVFRRAVLWFSVTGRIYRDQSAVVFDYMRDTLIEFARNVIITVPNHVARFVKAQLYFDARWLMISEVRFESGKKRAHLTRHAWRR